MPETQNSPVSVEPERQAETPSEKPAPGNPLRRIALGVAVLTAVLFTLSIFMERRTPSTSQAVVQAYVVEMAAEVGGRVTEIAVLDNARVKAGQVLFRIDPQPYKLVVSEAEARWRKPARHWAPAPPRWMPPRPSWCRRARSATTYASRPGE